MEIQGKVIEIEKNVLIEGKNGTYQGSKLVFKDNTGSIKEKAFHENTFKYNKAFEKELHALSVGDTFEATLEKKGEYWNWLAVKKTAGETQTPTKATPASTGSNWETAEERKKKQIYIIRQSSISSALKFAELQKDFFKGTDNPLSEVLAIADKLTDWVLENEPTVLANSSHKELINLEDDIPY